MTTSVDDYQLTDAERVALVQVAMNALTGHTTVTPAALLSALAKIAGTDTVLIARRAYPPTC
jgi:hypothetical protein